MNAISSFNSNAMIQPMLNTQRVSNGADSDGDNDGSGSRSSSSQASSPLMQSLMQTLAQSGISMNAAKSGAMDSDGDNDGSGSGGQMQQGIHKMMQDFASALSQAQGSRASSTNGYSNLTGTMQNLLQQLNSGTSSNTALKALQADYQNIVTSSQSQTGTQAPNFQTFLQNFMSNFSTAAKGSQTGNIINALKA